MYVSVVVKTQVLAVDDKSTEVLSARILFYLGFLFFLIRQCLLCQAYFRYVPIHQVFLPPKLFTIRYHGIPFSFVKLYIIVNILYQLIAMDSLLLNCFLDSLKHRITTNDLPMLTSTFYRAHMIPSWYETTCFLT